MAWRIKRFIEGEERSQITLLPVRLDDEIAEDNPVRVVDAFVDELKLRDPGFAGMDPAATGRPSFHPSILLMCLTAHRDLTLALPERGARLKEKIASSRSRCVALPRWSSNRRPRGLQALVDANSGFRGTDVWGVKGFGRRVDDARAECR